jgi:hypothetical protein
MVGAEMPMSSDQVVWSEQNRLHLAYKHDGVTANSTVQMVINTGVVTLGSHLTTLLELVVLLL